MKGIIVINAFNKPKASVIQAQRLRQEFNNLGVEADIVNDAFIRTGIKDNKILSLFSEVDFCVYLDKDKYVSKILEECGVRLFNSHKAIRVCDDKAETYIALAKHNISIPDSIFGTICYDKSYKTEGRFYDEIIKRLNFPIVIKECYGSMGKGVYLAKNKKQLIKIAKRVKLKPHLYQRYYGKKFGTDIRVILIGGKVVASMERHNDKDFRSNVAQGGKGRKTVLDGEFIKIAEKTAKALKLDYCGVDLLYGDDLKPIVCEVNSNAFFCGIEKTTGVNVAKEYAKYIVEKVKE